MPASSNLIPILCIRYCQFVLHAFIACTVKHSRFEKATYHYEGHIYCLCNKNFPPSIRIVYLANI
jgi:hypothetical protein